MRQPSVIQSGDGILHCGTCKNTEKTMELQSPSINMRKLVYSQYHKTEGKAGKKTPAQIWAHLS